jgi:hypothetical protein
MIEIRVLNLSIFTTIILVVSCTEILNPKLLTVKEYSSLMNIYMDRVLNPQLIKNKIDQIQIDSELSYFALQESIKNAKNNNLTSDSRLFHRPIISLNMRYYRIFDQNQISKIFV